MKDTKRTMRIVAAGICLLAGMTVQADEWPESKVRALERRALEADFSSAGKGGEP